MMRGRYQWIVEFNQDMNIEIDTENKTKDKRMGLLMRRVTKTCIFLGLENASDGFSSGAEINGGGSMASI